MILGSMTPETSVYLGRQIPRKFMKEIRSLELITADEAIKYFYSDAIVDIKEGMYFVTDKNLVVYCKSWEDPGAVIALGDIARIETNYDDSFFNDSQVHVETKDGLEISFPVSSEQGRDRLFVEYLRKNSIVGSVE